MNNCFDDLISLKTAHEQTGVPIITLKTACQRYARTGGKSGLESKHLEGVRGAWVTTLAAVQTFKDTQWRQRQGA